MMKTACTFVTSVLATVVVAAADRDGVWSGHNWIDNTNGIKDTEGILTGVNAKM